MALTQNSQNPYKLNSLEQIEFVYNQYFSLGTNTTQSFANKLELIKLVCFYWKYENKKHPDKYKNCIELLQAIFNKDLSSYSIESPGEDVLLITVHSRLRQRAGSRLRRSRA